MRLSFLAAILVLFAGSTAQAGFKSVSYTTNFGTSNAGFPTPDGSVPQFDPVALGGNLYSVTFEFEVSTVGGFLDAVNKTDHQVHLHIDFTDFATLGVSVNFTSPTNIFAGSVSANPFDSDLDPFDGFFSVIGTDSHFKGAYQTKDAVEKATYTGSGELEFLSLHDFQINAVSPGSDVSIGFSPDFAARGQVKVTYVYEVLEAPAPPGVVLCLSALPGVLILRRFRGRLAS
ncbi:hypothetical protein VT84_16240 [Gemmata sp. SH-PL17]|uniref:choice-of-anchor E domain-containing protein n=1 Tax=Gemmata sp. SH-PL17 TaxID=1630693 RepID=UPI0004B2CC2B|nr:choice-of-anchor E domain-containing protein [Gemmata sp. SH-PL17]AMV25949.1 hypothetical protein VT84_16240 [Gemmata sp. SH-PL17]